MKSRLKKLVTHLEQEAEWQQETVNVYLKPFTQDLINHKDDLLQELSRQVEDMGQNRTDAPGEDAMDAVIQVGDNISHQLNVLENELLQEIKEQQQTIGHKEQPDGHWTSLPTAVLLTAEEVACALVQDFPYKLVTLLEEVVELDMMRIANARVRAYLPESELKKLVKQDKVMKGFNARTPQ